MKEGLTDEVEKHKINTNTPLFFVQEEVSWSFQSFDAGSWDRYYTVHFLCL